MFRCSFTIYIKEFSVVLPTVLMSEDGGADGAGPHPEAGGELAGHLGVAAQVLP